MNQDIVKLKIFEQENNYEADKNESENVPKTDNIERKEPVAKKRKFEAIKTRRNGKTTQQILKKEIEAPNCHVSNEDLEKALKYLKNNKYSRDIMKEKCVSSIHFEKRPEKTQSSFFIKLLEEARKCLIEKNWDGLASVLVLAKPMTHHDYTTYFAVFLKYAYICLYFNPDKQLLNLFEQSVLMCSTDEEKLAIFRNFVCLNRT